MSEKLKLCPFCGGEATVCCSDWDSENYSPLPNTRYEVECNECLAGSDKYKTRELAIEAWNRRAERTGRWIGVADRLPEPGTNILVANAKTGSQYVSHRDLIWFNPERKAYVPTSYFKEFEFTHWMPLPEPPEVVLP
ncbi:MAG: DUF551 domain-containing protein [Clostridiales bacterium]|nr:DUF551 domain-containing protein [Clostridiales bacterium]